MSVTILGESESIPSVPFSLVGVVVVDENAPPNRGMRTRQRKDSGRAKETYW